MSESARPHLRVEIIEGVTVVHFVDRKLYELGREAPDEPGVGNAREVGAQLYSLVEDGGYRKLLLDFSNVEYMATHVLGKLLGLKIRVQKARGRLILCGLINPLVTEVFRVSGFDQMFEIHRDESTALERF
jgi:anti-sigma B factor antagonist